MGALHEQFLALPSTGLSYGRWVELGCPTDPDVLRAEADKQRERVLESLAKLPAIQDELGRHLDEQAGALVLSGRTL
jgi:hypothetical protein